MSIRLPFMLRDIIGKMVVACALFYDRIYDRAELARQALCIREATKWQSFAGIIIFLMSGWYMTE